METLVLDEQSPTPVEEQGEDVMRDVIPSSNILPWYARKERSIHTPTSVQQVETSLKPGEYVMRNLFAEFVIQADKKITSVMAEAFVSYIHSKLFLYTESVLSFFPGSFVVKIITKRRRCPVRSITQFLWIGSRTLSPLPFADIVCLV